MAKRIQVGGRIESKEVGGIVTGAAEILDDAKGKKQSVINGETDDELLRLDQSKQDNLTFDNAPTEGSDNPVKSGGLYTAQQAILLAIAAINELIPSAASTLNKLADKAFVNSSISTNTATFRGTSAAGLNEQQFLAWANGLEHDLNDYVFWQTSDAAGNTLFKRYKWNGTEWAYEYTLNNSTFTAEQWEAIQSGITALLVAKLRALPTAEQLIQSFDGKQDVLTFDDVPTLGSTNPVKSSGIYNVIKAITDLIPAEATAQNQLADKADVAAKIVAAIPSWKGQYDVLTDLQAVTGAKAGDMGCVKTTDSDGHAVLTFYQYSEQDAWVVYYTLRHYAQNKPATTGTTGDYPYNGMGRIELQKNIVNGVNTLTQAMLTQQNTIYVIQYDFTLGDDITVPANCVLEFDGGIISGNYKIISKNTIISGLIPNNPEIFYGTFYNNGKPLNYNLKVTKPLKSSLMYAFMNPAQYVSYLFYGQDIVSFYYNSEKYYLLCGNIESSTPERAFFLLFDSNFAFKGSNESPYTMHGNIAYANNKIYAVCYNNGNRGIAVYNVSEIVNKCISEYSDTPHNDTYSNKPQSINFIGIDCVLIDYDACSKEFVLLQGAAGYAIYDDNFNLIRNFNSNNEIESYLNKTGFKYVVQGVVIKNGIVYISYWMNDYPSIDRSNNALISYDTVNDMVLSFEKISTKFANPEIEGLCKDADDDNILYCLTSYNTDLGGDIVGIQALSQVSDIYGIEDNKESSDTIVADIREIYCYVDSSYDYSLGRSVGSVSRPYKTLDEAIAMQVSSAAETTFRIKGNGVSYFVPRIKLGNNTINFFRNGTNETTIVGSFWAYGSNVRFSNIKIIGTHERTLYSSSNGFIYLNECEVCGGESLSNKIGLILSDSASAQIDGNTVFKDCNFGIRVNPGCGLSGNIRTYNCITGLYLRSSNNNIGSASFEDASICFDVDNSKINIPNFTDISCTNCEKIIAKTGRGSANLVCFASNSALLATFLDTFMKLGDFDNTSVSLIISDTSSGRALTYDGYYLELGEYTYQRLDSGIYWFRDSEGYSAIFLNENSSITKIFSRTGTTQKRPDFTVNSVTKSNNNGFRYYDTDLNKPIFWTGDTAKGDNGWIDALGNNPSQS